MILLIVRLKCIVIKEIKFLRNFSEYRCKTKKLDYYHIIFFNMRVLFYIGPGARGPGIHKIQTLLALHDCIVTNSASIIFFFFFFNYRVNILFIYYSFFIFNFSNT